MAVKELYQSSTNEDTVEEFRKEASLLSNLHHPFVARFLGHTHELSDSHLLGISFSPPDKLYLVSEYYPYVLNKILDGDKPSKELRRTLILEIAQGMYKISSHNNLLAMEFLHSRNISHRDLKPENILLDSEMHVKVTQIHGQPNSVGNRLWTIKGGWQKPHLNSVSNWHDRVSLYLSLTNCPAHLFIWRLNFLETDPPTILIRYIS